MTFRRVCVKIPPGPAHQRIAPLRTLHASRLGTPLPLPPNLERLFGQLRFERSHSRPLVFSNMVTTLDGITSLQVKGHDAGGDISGFNAQDRMVMGLLRAIADVVIVGSGSLESDPSRMWTPDSICPELANDYRKLRATLYPGTTTLHVVASSSGRLDLSSPVFNSSHAPLLILTTQAGARRLRARDIPIGIEVRVVRRGSEGLAADKMLETVCDAVSPTRILVEGGPRLLGSFYAARLLAEQFLTLSPQVAGRRTGDKRISLTMGRQFAPKDPLWGALKDVRMGKSHLFLRYSFEQK